MPNKPAKPLADQMNESVEREMLKLWLDNPFNTTAIPTVQRLVEKELARKKADYRRKPSRRDIEILTRLSRGEAPSNVYRDTGQESKAFYRGIVRKWAPYFGLKDISEGAEGVEKIKKAFKNSVLNPDYLSGRNED